MSEAKIKIKIGNVKFSGEGDKDWLSEQLDKILSKAKDLIKLAPPAPALDENNSNNGSGEQAGGSGGGSVSSEIAKQTLPAFLKAKKAMTVQTQKFLATAVWSHAKGKDRLKTADIGNALKKSSLSGLTNASDCLNGNVKKGFCEKDGTEFFVTQEGKESLETKK